MVGLVTCSGFNFAFNAQCEQCWSSFKKSNRCKTKKRLILILRSSLHVQCGYLIYRPRTILYGRCNITFKKGEKRMGKSRFTKALFALMLVLLLALAACSGNDNDNDAKEPNNNTNSESEDNADNEDEVDGDLYSIEDFSTDKTNAGEAIEGGEATFGLVTDTAFAGILNYNFYSGTHDVEILDWFDEPLLTIDENYDYTQDGAAT